MENYKTKDVGIAAYLVVTGYRMIGTEWDGHRLYFVFEAAATQGVALYRITDEGQYAKRLLQAHRTLHGLILDEREAHA